jgi:predicted PurR-regulated permease PerM
MHFVAVALCLAVFVLCAPLAMPLVLAAWVADILQPAVAWLETRLRGRRRAAASVVVLLAVGVLALVLGVGAGLVSGARDFIAQIRAAVEGEGTLSGALLGGPEPKAEPIDWADLGSRYGANAWRALTTIAQASATAAIGILVFIVGLYTFAVDGVALRKWLAAHAPIPNAAFTRISAAFYETGRGLLVAGGGTAVVQGLVATVAYFGVGIPRALLLGPLTGLCAIVPFVGTAIVWVPLAIELALTGHHGRAIAILVVGVVVSTIDNVVRPFLARRGRLKLPTFGVLVSMLGGIALFGATGALLGPLVLRLCVEALAILSEGRSRTAPPSEAPP